MRLRNLSNINNLERFQKFLLLLASLFILSTVPSYWIQVPDSGWYLASAQSIITEHRYWFNGAPNLQYYPGFASILIPPLVLFGKNFFALQFYVASIALVGVWGLRKYYSVNTYGYTALFLPILLITSSIFTEYMYVLYSDCTFLALTIFALLSWRKYLETYQVSYLAICFLLVSISSLVRFQGLFICAAFSVALLMHAWSLRKQVDIVKIACLLTLCGLVFLPFGIWTIRNYLLYTPDTFNMANSRFFGLSGLALYAEGFPGGTSLAGISEGGYIPIQRAALFFGGLLEFWYGGISLTNKKIIFPLILLILSFGVRPWLKRANYLEFFYVLFSLAYIGNSLFMKDNLHIVLRYWVPVLPFFVLIMGLGIQSILNWKILAFTKPVSQVFTVLVVITLLVISLPNLTRHIGLEEKRGEESRALAAVKVFTDINIPINAVVATTEWGIMPSTINRRSFPVLNDPDHKETIARMLKYQTEFLITYGKFSRRDVHALNLVAKHNDVFTKVFGVNEGEPNLAIMVYKINLRKLENIQ